MHFLMHPNLMIFRNTKVEKLVFESKIMVHFWCTFILKSAPTIPFLKLPETINFFDFFKNVFLVIFRNHEGGEVRF